MYMSTNQNRLDQCFSTQQSNYSSSIVPYFAVLFTFNYHTKTLLIKYVVDFMISFDRCFSHIPGLFELHIAAENANPNL